MSLTKNILANYVSQAYVALIGIAIVPLYIKYMGPEAYGLVGFFAVLQAFFNLLDIGLSQTVARESARCSGGETNAQSLRQLVRALEGIFAGVAVLSALLLVTFADFFSGNWFKASMLPRADIASSLQLMGIAVALRWMSGLYRGVISGAERFVWLGSFNSLVATGRFILVLPLLMFYSSSPITFFGFQLLIAVLELVAVAVMAYRTMPSTDGQPKIKWHWQPLKPVLKFSLSIAFTSLVWVLVTQTDKLVLSKVLPLAEYGYFTVVVLVASGLLIITGPISAAILPHMSRLQAEKLDERLITVYRQSTQLTTVVVTPITLVLVFFAPQVLWAWTGDTKLISQAGSALRLYALGYGILAVSAFQYYLQYAKGDLTLHLVGSAVFVVSLVPSVVWAANEHGMEGAGWAWLISNALYFFMWTPLVHRRFCKGMHVIWLGKDVGTIMAPVTILCVVIMWLTPWPTDRWGVFCLIVFIYIVLSIAAAAFSSSARQHLGAVLSKI